MMREQLLTFIDELKADRRINSFDEAATKQAIILRSLSILGWNQHNIDELYPEYSISEGRVDYSLRINNTNKAFIEVKKVGEELEPHQEQLLKYSFQEGVELAILTNGTTWWFYLPLQPGAWEQRKFYTIDIFQQESVDIASKFIDFLAKENIANDKAIENAKQLYKGQQKENILKETLPEAWNKIVSEPDKSLIELINDTTEKLCGYKPEDELIKRFLLKSKEQLLITDLRQPAIRIDKRTGKTAKRKTKKVGSLPDFTNKRIEAFSFLGTRYEVGRPNYGLLIKLGNIISNLHRGEFEEKVLVLKGRKRPYFTNNKNELHEPEKSPKINDTNIFVENNLNNNLIVKIAYDLIGLFGYSKDDLTIEVR
jgi:predicted type IV restriction endonuclease